MEINVHTALLCLSKEWETGYFQAEKHWWQQQNSFFSWWEMRTELDASWAIDEQNQPEMSEVWTTSGLKQSTDWHQTVTLPGGVWRVQSSYSPCPTLTGWHLKASKNVTKFKCCYRNRCYVWQATEFLFSFFVCTTRKSCEQMYKAAITKPERMCLMQKFTGKLTRKF